jgi:hypothetical protein
VVKNKCKSMKDDSNTDNTCRGRLIWMGLPCGKRILETQKYAFRNH